MLDPPQPSHLLHDEKRIHPDVDRSRATPLRLLETQDQRAVLGHVIGRATERAGQLRHHFSLVVVQDGAGTGRTGIPARRPVRVEHEPHSAKICDMRVRSTFPPETIETTRSPGRTGIFPAMRAPVAAAPAGSATSFARCARKRIPSAMRSSPITTTSATRCRTISSGIVPA